MGDVLRDRERTIAVQGETTEQRAIFNYWKLIEVIVPAIRGVSRIPKWVFRRIKASSEIKKNTVRFLNLLLQLSQQLFCSLRLFLE